MSSLNGYDSQLDFIAVQAEVIFWEQAPIDYCSYLISYLEGHGIKAVAGEGGAQRCASLRRWRRWWMLGLLPKRTSTYPASTCTELSRETATKRGSRYKVKNLSAAEVSSGNTICVLSFLSLL